VQRDVAMGTNFGTNIAAINLTGVVCTIATRKLVMDGSLIGRQKADIADTLHIRDVAMATTFWLSSEPCENGCTDRDAVWVEDSGKHKEPCPCVR